MNSDRNWWPIGWLNIDRVLEIAEEKGYQIRYQDNSRVIIRIPPIVGRSEQWQVYDRVDGCVTRDWWCQLPRSKRVLREVLTEQFSRDVARYIMDGVPIPMGDDE